MAILNTDNEIPAISIIYDDPDDLDGAKGLRSAFDRAVRKVGDLDVSTFKDRFGALCSHLVEAVNAVEVTTKDYGLESFEVTVDVTAKGEVRLVGSVGTEVKGGIKLVFKKYNQAT
jgi:hypothetical protein